MNTMTYDVELPLAFDDTIQQVEAALKTEQFGIISRIDLHATFKQKLNVDGLPHTILGACNPRLAYKAVSAMPAAAVMLPCNVTVQAVENERTIVRMVSPAAIMALGGLENEPVVREVSEEADNRLKRVARALAAC